ncbi:hypothetical protein O9992_18515 [Vibrio lentus]|nr:hypothetical protein [Vibrio lentus]
MRVVIQDLAVAISIHIDDLNRNRGINQRQRLYRGHHSVYNVTLASSLRPDNIRSVTWMKSASSYRFGSSDRRCFLTLISRPSASNKPEFSAPRKISAVLNHPT